ncbi:MAG: polysaccharide deacetylase [Hyphomicrobium sp.]|nr:polysaccharide deacetylase [Hyphomicrobium sp.]PPD07030.1 MAG: polysaccharide deacetylase [Hyphomicrobium sp.]
MSRKTTSLIKAALSALHYARADTMLAPLTGGAGGIFTLHHVRPEPPQDFEPNRILKITPEFLEAVLSEVLAAGFDVIGLDDVATRLAAGPAERPFACFTFDDGYRDNRDYALPVFRKFGLPFTVFVPANFPTGNADLWWLVLEEAIRRANTIDVPFEDGSRRYETSTVAAKERAFHEIYWQLRRMNEEAARAIVSDLACQNGVDGRALARDLLLNWDELRALASDPLVTIGAHTNDHYALAKLPEDRARAEIVESIATLEKELGRPCRHFSFPYGDPGAAGEREFRLASEAGVATAVTTRKGLIHARHQNRLTALPRVSLNGDYQDTRFVKVFMSGAPFALRDAAKRLFGATAAA